jgi:hypothetical protein
MPMVLDIEASGALQSDQSETMHGSGTVIMKKIVKG